MTRVRTFGALVAGLVLPVVATAQGANAKPDPGSPTAERLPIYVIDPTWPPTLPNDWILGDMQRWILKGTRPASSVQPPAQER